MKRREERGETKVRNCCVDVGAIGVRLSKRCGSFLCEHVHQKVQTD